MLLTYQCTLECEHCFTWGSPWQSGTMSLHTIRRLLRQAQDVGTVSWIFVEGGEPFLYYPLLLAAVREAAEMGFQVGAVSNGYWATSVEDAIAWLRPMAGALDALSVSSDIYHWNERLSRQAQHAQEAAEQLGISIGTISVAQPEARDVAEAVGQLPDGESAVMYRGRAVKMLVERASRQPWERFTACPYEDLVAPGRLHVDALGYLHICQGISVGNVCERTLRDICASYDPSAHPIVSPLVDGGPAALVRRYALPHAEGYADACHLCYEARTALRSRFPRELAPDQMYGDLSG
jgi:organic radical activating enzyme